LKWDQNAWRIGPSPQAHSFQTSAHLCGSLFADAWYFCTHFGSLLDIIWLQMSSLFADAWYFAHRILVLGGTCDLLGPSTWSMGFG
jgi:hypothetical protein